MTPEDFAHKRKIGRINFGDLRRLTPWSGHWGFDRGTPVDRYYIEKFLKVNKADIKGSVLEMENSYYTKRFGGKKVKYSDVLDINRSNKSATIYADLRVTKALPKRKYDCIILTQTLHIIDNYDVVIKNIRGMLKKNGILLCTLPSASRIDYIAEELGDFWRFTKASARYIFKKHFAENKLQIQTYGNVFIDICFLTGISAEEISREELDYYDKYFPLIVSVRAVK
jgi:SAM-dependent methyltransferase